MIKSKPATQDYINNFDRIFRKVPMKRYRVPVDIYIMANNADYAEKAVNQFMDMAKNDLGPSFNVSSFVFPVGYPTEPEALGEVV
jgi:hypothetical protein